VLEVFLAVADGEPVGFSAYTRNFSTFAGRPVLFLEDIFVEEEHRGKGYGKAFVKFYEDYALQNGCPYLRIDTNERNIAARRMYEKLGYKEVGIVPCTFNGLPDVQLVLLEKCLDR